MPQLVGTKVVQTLLEQRLSAEARRALYMDCGQYGFYDAEYAKMAYPVALHEFKFATCCGKDNHRRQIMYSDASTGAHASSIRAKKGRSASIPNVTSNAEHLGCAAFSIVHTKLGDIDMCYQQRSFRLDADRGNINVAELTGLRAAIATAFVSLVLDPCTDAVTIYCDSRSALETLKYETWPERRRRDFLKTGSVNTAVEVLGEVAVAKTMIRMAENLRKRIICRWLPSHTENEILGHKFADENAKSARRREQGYPLYNRNFVIDLVQLSRLHTMRTMGQRLQHKQHLSEPGQTGKRRGTKIALARYCTNFQYD